MIFYKEYIYIYNLTLSPPSHIYIYVCMFIYTYVCAYYYSEIESLLLQFVYISMSSPLMNLVFMLNVGYEMLEQHISVNSTFNYKKKKKNNNNT